MKFQRESGAIVSNSESILHLVMGDPGKVEFPEEVIWSLHKQAPGCVYSLAHVHPPQMPQLSGRDKTTMRAWARAMFPFPIRMTTITELPTDDPFGYEGNNYFVFLETCYMANLEAKETWEARGKEGTRTINIQEEWQKKHRIILPSHKFFPPWHGTFLVEMSYQDVDKR